jgi:uncharacterized protein YydD (DUF2326 family)
MFLKKLYSEPLGLFRSGKPAHPYTIVFKEGFNFIFGKKDSSDSKEPLNGLGKSTVADLIDFCLLADFSSNNSRLYKEKNRLENYFIILEFELNQNHYTIQRNTASHQEVNFGRNDSFQKLPLKEAKSLLFQLIFKKEAYQGVADDKWYRSLIAFFLKIHKKTKGEFTDPIQFLTTNNKLSEMNPFHFLLLGLDNTLLCENFELQKEVNDRQTAISQIKKFIENNYKLDIKQVDSQLSKLRNEIKKSKAAVDAFKLAEHHKDVETRLNELTKQVKVLSEQNFWMQKKIGTYKESYELKDILTDNTIRDIGKLYKEIHEPLSQLVHKSLEQAIDFRKKLAQSREEFLKSEIQSIELEIQKNEKTIQDLDKQRQNLFLLLKSKEAFTDLTQAFYYLAAREQEYAHLESRIKMYKDLELEKLAYKKRDADIGLKMNAFITAIQENINGFEKIFSEVYNQIYPHSQSSGFSITSKDSKDKIKIDISFDKDESKGWNKGRTLVYDIAIMLHAIAQGIRCPRFLLHDGIFDGMDKSQFVALYHFVSRLQQQGIAFQYIVTMIEEGELRGNFGKTDDLTIEHITEEAIAVFTPSQKFWVG